MQDTATTISSRNRHAIDQGRRVALVAITAVALVLFVGIGGSVLGSTLAAATGKSAQIDRSLLIALLLNIALILFGWRKHRDLAAEVEMRAAVEARAFSLAANDALTGFLNRRSLAEEGTTMFVRAHRRDKAMAMLMIDLDHFKSVNDLHGHATGDALLRLVAREISAAMPPAALTARFGSDEFACAFLFDPGHPDTIDRIAERLVSQLARPFDVAGERVHVSASIGVARSDFDCPSIDALMRAADMAMYAAKKDGRNRYVWFDRAMEQALLSRNAVESGLRLAIPNGEIVPYFEKQVDLATGRLTGFEVLARWDRPGHGVIPPDRFIGIAEECGLIGELSLSLLRQACAAARDWDPGITLSVNISAVQLRDAWLAQKIIKTLVETGFPASRLEIEITESALFADLALAQSIVGSLKNQGIRIALDDFGTGYSSLSHLRALPFDRIKIDRSFVASIADNAESAAIVSAIAGLGETLNLPITAEGIEDSATEARLLAMGCGKGQGYLYGRPLALADTRRLLESQRMLTGSPVVHITSRRRAG